MSRRRVCIVGSGTTYLSGISYYTYFLARALASDIEVSVILMRKLVPRVLYPGRNRVGVQLTNVSTNEFAPTFNGIDWTLFPSLPRAVSFLRRQQPEFIVLQWWSVSSLLAYLVLARAGRRSGARVILELHEDLDTREASVPILGPLAARLVHVIFDRADAYVVHSNWDMYRLRDRYGLDERRCYVIPHGPFEVTSPRCRPERKERITQSVTILFFGTIRPYKGLEYLIDAFDSLPREEGQSWRLVIVGETWGNWVIPLQKVSASPHSNDIEVCNRYATDEEVKYYFGIADIVALPYLRSSASGPLHLTMAAGLPVVVTRVGGLTAAAESYSGAVLVNAADADDLRRGILEARQLVGRVHKDPYSWDAVRKLYEAVFVKASAEGSEAS